MSTSVEIYRAIQAKARSEAARTGKPVATGEYLTRHALECFLYRLTQTTHADAFVLKGGILLTAYDVRRPTKIRSSGWTEATESARQQPKRRPSAIGAVQA